MVSQEQKGSRSQKKKERRKQAKNRAKEKKKQQTETDAQEAEGNAEQKDMKRESSELVTLRPDEEDEGGDHQSPEVEDSHNRLSDDGPNEKGEPAKLSVEETAAPDVASEDVETSQKTEGQLVTDQQPGSTAHQEVPTPIPGTNGTNGLGKSFISKTMMCAYRTRLTHTRA